MNDSSPVRVAQQLQSSFAYVFKYAKETSADQHAYIKILSSLHISRRAAESLRSTEIQMIVTRESPVSTSCIPQANQL